MAEKGSTVKFGLDSVYYAMLTISDTGEATYGAPKPMPGSVNLTLSVQGETNKFYADNRAYYVSTSNDGYQGDLELALVPESFRVDVLAEVLDSTDKVRVEYSTAETKPFALLFRFKEDQKDALRIMYNCSCARASEEGSTMSNNKVPTTEKLSITASPLGNGMVKASSTDDTPEEVRANWFKSVWMPSQVGV